MHLQIWRFLVLYQEVSRGSRVVIFVLLSLISFASLGKSISLSTPPCKLLIKILSIWCRVVSQRREVYFQAFVRRRSVHFTLRSCAYHTRSLDCFPARLPSEIRPKHPWSGTWISFITMCVESSALMVIASGLYTILSFVSWPGQNFMMDITPHIYVGGLQFNYL